MSLYFNYYLFYINWEINNNMHWSLSILVEVSLVSVVALVEVFVSVVVLELRFVSVVVVKMWLVSIVSVVLVLVKIRFVIVVVLGFTLRLLSLWFSLWFSLLGLIFEKSSLWVVSFNLFLWDLFFRIVLILVLIVFIL